MKIQGRFIAILAVLGLLIALLPLASVGAAAGEVTLSGGAEKKGNFFSDQTVFNIVAIDVEDSDLSPVRVGTARLQAKGPDFLLKMAVIGGEKPQVDEFNGGNKDGENAVEGGDAVYLDYSKDNEEGDGDTWTFTLSDTARDANDDGVLDYKDFTVVVDGSTKENVSGFTVPPATGDGDGVTTVVLYVNPDDTTDNVVITYEVSEYEFASATPIRLSGTQVHHGTSYAGALSQRQIDSVTPTVAKVTTTSKIGADTHVVVTFVYHVKDTAKEYATVTSNTSLATGVDRVLDGVESTARSSLFESEIALFEGTDYTKIVEQSGNDVNSASVSDGDGNTDVNIGELNNTRQLGKELFKRVTDTANALGFKTHTTDKAEDLIAMLLPVTHGDTVSVAYVDANPSTTVVRTAQVDLEAPVVTLIGPSDGIYTRESLVTFSANVVDSGAGVKQVDIGITATTGISLGTPQLAPIVDGYKVTGVSQSALSEGVKKWAITVVDGVGNVPAEDILDSNLPADCGPAPKLECGKGPVDVNEGAKGAVGPGKGITAVANPFKFAVDTKAPTLVSGKTGISLKNPGVTTGEDSGKESENTDQRQWLRVVFSAGDGTAPLDPATITASDFRVGQAEPLDVKVNSRAQGKDQEIKKGLAVYLQVGQMDTDSRPRVDLVGEIRDRAGNIRTEASISAITDGLAPVLEVTPSATIANDEVTITISSSERLGLNPDVQVTSTKPVKGEALVSPDPLTVSLQIGGLKTWTTTFDNPAGAASKQYIVVEVNDQAGNDNIVGDASNDDDFVSFQVDDKDPSLKFVDAGGEDLEDSKQEEGAVWLVMEFDEDEHTGDSYRKVEVTEVTLMNMDTDEVVTEDVSVLFGSEVVCVDHEVTGITLATATDAQKDKCAEHTLPVNLTPGMYNIAVTGVDQTGNEKSANVDFEVTEAEPFELTLRPGQNFISIKGMPMGDGGMLDNLFSDPAITSVSTYDRSLELQGANPWLRSSKDLETGMFSGDITMLEPGKAYFVNSSASVTVKVKLQPPGDLPPTIPVRQGYNAIGFWSISGADDAEFDLYLGSIGWSVAYSYDPTPGKGWTVIRKGELDSDDNPRNIEAGNGYLVYALYDAVLTP